MAITGEQESNVSFWCDKDRKDFDLRAWKRNWTWQGACEEYWMAYCPICKGKLVRYAGEMKTKDPYYRKSEKMRKEARKYRKYLLQPGETGFQTQYGEAHTKIQSQKEKAAQKKEKRRKELEEKHKKVQALHGFKYDKTAQKLKELYLGENNGI